MPDDVSSWHNAEVVSPSRLRVFTFARLRPLGALKGCTLSSTESWTVW